MSKISCKLNNRSQSQCTQTKAEDKISKAVNHPSHYKSGGMEAIEVIEAFKLDRDFCLGNCAKYLLRLGRKDDELQDAKKCRWYLDRYIKKLEEQKAEYLATAFERDYEVNMCGMSTATKLKA